MNKAGYSGLFGLMLVLGGCASAPKDPVDVIPDDESATTTPVVIGGVTGTNVDPDSIAGRAPQNRTIYFAFDDAEIQSEYLSVIAEHGRYLAQNSAGKVRLEGHTDERGSREYNIGLGESRAKSVERMLQLQGVSASQLKSVSYGEELPVDDAPTAAAWDKNRRVYIVYEAE